MLVASSLVAGLVVRHLRYGCFCQQEVGSCIALRCGDSPGLVHLSFRLCLMTTSNNSLLLQVALSIYLLDLGDSGFIVVDKIVDQTYNNSYSVYTALVEQMCYGVIA